MMTDGRIARQEIFNELAKRADRLHSVADVCLDEIVRLRAVEAEVLQACHSQNAESDRQDELTRTDDTQARAEAQGPIYQLHDDSVGSFTDVEKDVFDESKLPDCCKRIVYTAPQSPAPCQKCDEACRTEAEAALRLGKALIEISTLQAKVAELEKVAKAYEDQVAAHNKALDEVARLSALIEKCEKALIEARDDVYSELIRAKQSAGYKRYDDEIKRQMAQLVRHDEAITAIAAQKGGV